MEGIRKLKFSGIFDDEISSSLSEQKKIGNLKSEINKNSLKIINGKNNEEQ